MAGRAIEPPPQRAKGPARRFKPVPTLLDVVLVDPPTEWYEVSPTALSFLSSDLRHLGLAPGGITLDFPRRREYVPWGQVQNVVAETKGHRWYLYVDAPGGKTRAIHIPEGIAQLLYRCPQGHVPPKDDRSSKLLRMNGHEALIPKPMSAPPNNPSRSR